MRSASVRLSGHPDQLCDLVAEAIVDEYAKRDPESRLRIHVQGGRGVMFVSGDILSQADFDVASVVKRTVGAAGVTDEIEPFISLEQVIGERVGAFRLGPETPVAVTGYATRESPLFLPQTVVLAREFARILEEKRAIDPEWFWLGPDGEVTVVAHAREPSLVFLTIEHGQRPLDEVREQIRTEFRSRADLPVEINVAGCREARGLKQASGSSGCSPSLYGSFICLPGTTGQDVYSAEKAGSWLTRAVAREVLQKQDVKAVMLQALYVPGEYTPRFLSARDEKGRDLTSTITREDLSLERVMRDWWRQGLHSDSLRWSATGVGNIPWEE